MGSDGVLQSTSTRTPPSGEAEAQGEAMLAEVPQGAGDDPVKGSQEHCLKPTVECRYKQETGWRWKEGRSCGSPAKETGPDRGREWGLEA